MCVCLIKSKRWIVAWMIIPHIPSFDHDTYYIIYHHITSYNHLRPGHIQVYHLGFAERLIPWFKDVKGTIWSSGQLPMAQESSRIHIVSISILLKIPWYTHLIWFHSSPLFRFFPSNMSHVLRNDFSRWFSSKVLAPYGATHTSTPSTAAYLVLRTLCRCPFWPVATTGWCHGRALGVELRLYMGIMATTPIDRDITPRTMVLYVYIYPGYNCNCTPKHSYWRPTKCVCLEKDTQKKTIRWREPWRERVIIPPEAIVDSQWYCFQEKIMIRQWI
jgi:hypothetical protein